MSALAALREGETDVARAQLQELVVEFPENSLFGSELAKLKVSPPSAFASKVNSRSVECD
jgi:predicted Zn-dependent protease